MKESEEIHVTNSAHIADPVSKAIEGRSDKQVKESQEKLNVSVEDLREPSKKGLFSIDVLLSELQDMYAALNASTPPSRFSEVAEKLFGNLARLHYAQGDDFQSAIKGACEIKIRLETVNMAQFNSRTIVTIQIAFIEHGVPKLCKTSINYSDEEGGSTLSSLVHPRILDLGASIAGDAEADGVARKMPGQSDRLE